MFCTTAKMCYMHNDETTVANSPKNIKTLCKFNDKIKSNAGYITPCNLQSKCLTYQILLSSQGQEQNSLQQAAFEECNTVKLQTKIFRNNTGKERKMKNQHT